MASTLSNGYKHIVECYVFTSFVYRKIVIAFLMCKWKNYGSRTASLRKSELIFFIIIMTSFEYRYLGVLYLHQSFFSIKIHLFESVIFLIVCIQHDVS